MVVLQLPMQSVPITTDVVSSNPPYGEVYSVQHFVIKFVNEFGGKLSKLTKEKKYIIWL
jgi:23S rRNA G2445 N2-methylase RlmL